MNEAMKREEQLAILERFFGECLRYWERELKTNHDIDKEPYINAIKEIPVNYPYTPNGEPFDKEVREEFIKYRLMDCYGKDWELHRTEVR